VREVDLVEVAIMMVLSFEPDLKTGWPGFAEIPSRQIAAGSLSRDLVSPCRITRIFFSVGL
jgi:hypothetical protein